MRLQLAAILLALLMVSAPVWAEEKKPTLKPADRQLQLSALIQDFIKARRAANAAMLAAETDAERKAAEAKMPKESDFLPRVLALISGEAKDDIAADALSLAVFGLGTKDMRVFDALAKHFVKTDKINRFVQMATTGAPTGAKPVLENVLADNPSNELKGKACFALGTLAAEMNDDASVKEAEKYFTRAEKEFGEVKMGQRGTIGEMAKASLYELRNLRIGMKAPATECKTLKGEPSSLADYKGKVVILDFWATWCTPCKEMIPHEREMVEKFKTKPFALVSISVDEDKKELEEFLEQEKMPWIHWWAGPDSSIVKQWNVQRFPTIYVIDAKGIIRHKHIRGAELEMAVAKLLEEEK
jgi:peroxiredoxin